MITPLDHYLLRAYLDGEMDEPTSTAFEIRLMERPDLAELVEADTLLGMGLTAAPAPGEAANDPAEPPQAIAPNVVPLAPPRRELPRGGLLSGGMSRFVAVASLVVAVGLLAERLVRPARIEPAVEPVTIVQVDATRDAAPQALRLTVPSSGKTVFAVAFADASNCASRVTISQPGRKPIEGAATVDGFHFANVVVDASRLAEGSGEIAVGCQGSATARTYSVEFAH